MKIIKKIEIIIAVGLIGMAGHVFAKSNYVFATEATYPPFESMSANNKIVGFDADLVVALCAKIKVKCSLVNDSFTSLIPALNLGKYDSIIGGLAITPQRLKVVNFSSIYYNDPVVLVSYKSAHLKLDPKGLSGKSIAVQSGSSFQGFLQIYYKNSYVKGYMSNLQGLLDLKSHRVDVDLIDLPVFKAWLKSEKLSSKLFDIKNASQTNQQALYFGPQGPGNAIAVAKNNPIFLKKINTALADLNKDGQLAQLQHKWFGL